mmetsp:Transcript_763/g.2279  ORF Transcript_763/g.2279 Transcript_763/m.2279 type:complete len:210 (+) Transcript_763:243-872(+)
MAEQSSAAIWSLRVAAPSKPSTRVGSRTRPFARLRWAHRRHLSTSASMRGSPTRKSCACTPRTSRTAVRLRHRATSSRSAGPLALEAPHGPLQRQQRPERSRRRWWRWRRACACTSLAATRLATWPLQKDTRASRCSTQWPEGGSSSATSIQQWRRRWLTRGLSASTTTSLRRWPPRRRAYVCSSPAAAVPAIRACGSAPPAASRQSTR